MQVNNLFDHGAIRVTADGRVLDRRAEGEEGRDRPDPRHHDDPGHRRLRGGRRAAEEDGDVVRPEVQRVLDRLGDVPVDIAPEHITARGADASHEAASS